MSHVALALTIAGSALCLVAIILTIAITAAHR
jgi:hypothetical protein